jgi:Flp pilus assembly protein TadD
VQAFKVSTKRHAGAENTGVKRARKRHGAPVVHTPQPDKRRPVPFGWQIIAVATVGLIVRLVYVWQIRDSPFFDVLMGDARRYDVWATQIASGDVIGREVFYQAPLYPYFLGAIYAIAGRSLLIVRICQALIGTAACVFLALTARRLYSERAGLAAGLALAVYAPAVFFDGLMQKSSLDLFFVCLSLWMISGLVDQPRTPSRWFSLGVAVGALALTRENALILAAVILLWALGRSQFTQRQRTLNAGVFVLGVTLILSPVAVRNRVIGGEWHLTTSQLGPNLYIGNNPDADGTYAALREGRGTPEYERQDATELAEAATGRRLTPGEVSSFWVGRTAEFVRSQPAAWLGLMAKKAALVWSGTEFVDTESQASYEEWSSLLRVLAAVGHFGVVVPLAVLGMFVTWRDRSRAGVYYAMSAAYVASIVIFYVSDRYRLPLVPFLILFAAAGVVSLAPFVRTATRPTIAAAAVVTGAVAFATNRPLLSADLLRATTETNLGVALQTDGRLEEAEAHYRRSIAIDPDYGPAYVNLGIALMARGNESLQAGRPAEAIGHFSRAISAGQRSADLYNNLGIALVRMNREDEAIAAYKESLQLNPNNSVLRFTLGSMLVKAGKFEQAIGEFRAGLALAPDSAEAHNNLGGALAATGRTAEAIAEFEYALRLNPGLASARRNLDLVRGR